jgi:hypothetical protein
MSIQTLEVGQDVSASATFTEVDGTLVNPTTVNLTVYKPDGTTLSPSPGINHPSVGHYDASFTLTVRGNWTVHWTSTGPGTAHDDIVIADWSSVPGATQLVTLQEYRDITKDATTENEEVNAHLARAILLIEEYLQRRLESRTYTEVLEVWWDGYVYPINTPVTAVPPSAAYEIDVGGRRIFGSLGTYSVVTGWWWPDSNRAAIEYTGGFTNVTLPYTLKEYICFVARSLIRRTTGTLIGAQEASVGDVRVKYPSVTGALDSLVPGASLGLRPYKRKRVRS